MTNLPRTELRAIHNSRPESILGVALQQIEGYAETKAQLSALPALVNAPSIDGIDSRPLVDAIVADALDADQALDSPEVRVAAANAHVEALGFTLVASSVERLRSQIGSDLDGMVRSHLDPILRFLNESLQANIVAVRDLADQLRAIDNFDDADQAGLVDELRALRQREAEYREVREAQHRVMSKVADEQITASPIAHIQDPLVADVEQVLGDLGVAISAAHALRLARPSLPSDWTSNEALRWQLEHPESKPWIPDTRQLRAAQARQNAQISAAREFLGPKHMNRDDRQPFEANRLPELQRHLATVR